MSINENSVSEIARQLGLSGSKGVSKAQIDYLSSKSDAELERELLKMRDQLKASGMSYEKQLAMMKSIAPMLDAKQRQRLDRLMNVLKTK